MRLPLQVRSQPIADDQMMTSSGPTDQMIKGKVFSGQINSGMGGGLSSFGPSHPHPMANTAGPNGTEFSGISTDASISGASNHTNSNSQCSPAKAQAGAYVPRQKNFVQPSSKSVYDNTLSMLRSGQDKADQAEQMAKEQELLDFELNDDENEYSYLECAICRRKQLVHDAANEQAAAEHTSIPRGCVSYQENANPSSGPSLSQQQFLQNFLSKAQTSASKESS